MKKLIIIFLILPSLVFALAAATPELEIGVVHEFEASGFISGYKSGAAYGLDFGMKYSCLYLDLSPTFRLSDARPLKARMSLNLAFDFWKMRIALGVGNDLSLIKSSDGLQIAWGGVPGGSIIDTPLFIRLESSFFFSSFKMGLVMNFATPWIITKNNFPDIFKAYGDRDLFLYYAKSSSFAVVLQLTL